MRGWIGYFGISELPFRFAPLPSVPASLPSGLQAHPAARPMDTPPLADVLLEDVVQERSGSQLAEGKQ